MKLAEYKDRLVSCKACGTCSYGRGPNNPFTAEASPSHRCPSLDKYHFMSYGPRGRLYLARLLQRGEISIDEDLAKIFYTCTDCGMCEELCFHPFTDIIKSAKVEIAKIGFGPPENNRKANENIRKFFNPLGEIGLNRADWANGMNLPRKAEVMFFAGCKPSYRQDELAKTAVNLLRQAGVDVGYLNKEEWCCGRPADWDGQPDIQEIMAMHNIKAMKEAGAKEVVFACPGCYLTFKNEYPEIVGKLPFDVIHITEYLVQFINSDKFKFEKFAGKVTYHDPCHLGRFAGIIDQPRKLIASVPDIELVEMERHGRFSYCCGNNVDFSNWVASQRIAEAKKTANIVITACPRCVQNLSIASRNEKIGIPVYSITTFLSNKIKK